MQTVGYLGFSERIVCLTEETVETLYLLGEEHRIAGVSGYAVRPPRVRREKPRVSAFISADVPKILALAPDLVLAFSDLQAAIVADLVRAIERRWVPTAALPTHPVHGDLRLGNAVRQRDGDGGEDDQYEEQPHIHGAIPRPS